MARSPVRHSLPRSTFYSIAGRAGSVLVWLLVTPFVLGRLGPERFGVWSLLFALSGYATVLDLGVGSSVSRFVARSAAGGLRDPVAAVIRRSLLLSTAMGVLWGLLLVAATGAFERAFHVPAGLAPEVEKSLLLFAAALAVTSAAQVPQGALIGFQRFDRSNLAFLAGLALQAIVLVAGLLRGGGLRVTVLAMLAGQVVALVIALIALKPELARLAPGGGGGAWRWRDFLGFSAAVQVTNVVALGVLQLGKVLLGLFGSLALVTQFELGLRVANAAWSLPQLVQAPIVPAAAHALAERGPGAVTGVYLWACRWAFAIGGIAFALLWLTAPGLYRLWLGPGHEGSAGIARTLALSLTAAMLLGPATAVARGGGWPFLETGALVTVLIVNVGAGVALVRALSAQGAAIATGIAFAVAAAWLLVVLHRRLSVANGAWWWRTAGPRLAFPALAAALVWVATRHWPFDSKADALRLVAVQCAAFLVLAALFSLATGDAQVVWERARRRLGAWPAPGAGRPAA